MRALIYADWIIIRKTILRYLGFALLILSPIVILANGDEEFAPGTSAAVMCVVMVTFYLVIGLFSADETNGWELVRLTLPTSTHQVVRSRYVFMVLVLAIMAVVGTILGIVVEWVIPLFHGVLTVPRGGLVVCLASLGACLMLMVFLAIEMPIMFWKGMTKARMALSIPMLLPLLLTIEPTRDAVMSFAEKLEGIEKALGTPVPIFIAIAAIACVLYVASMLLSERVYAARDF